MKNMICKIVGGHKYSNTNIQTHYDEISHNYRFRNRCLRCGKYKEWEVPLENLIPQIAINPFYVDAKDDEEDA